MQSPVEKSLVDVFLQFIEKQSHACSSGSCESPMQALKRALAESPRDSFRIEASKRRIIFAESRSLQLTSANQAIQEALIIADQKVRVAPNHLHTLLYDIASSSSLGFTEKRGLLELLVPASSEAQPTESQVDKSFTKIINDSSREDACSSGSHLELAAMTAITTNPGMIWALTERLLHATDRRRPEENALDIIYTEAFADAILALGESMPSLDAAETALAVAADRWTGPSHTRGEVKRFVHLGRARIRLFKDAAFKEAIKSAINRIRGREALCPLKDIMNDLCEVPAASPRTRLLVDRLVLYSKPPPEDYCSVKKSSIKPLKLYGSSSTSSKTTSLEILVRAILSSSSRWTLSMKRELLRRVLVDSKTPPPEPIVDQAFRRTIAAAVEDINSPSDSSRDPVDYLLDAIDKDDYSSTYGPCMKQALIEQLVFACKPHTAEFSESRALAHSIAVGVRPSRKVLPLRSSLDRPPEEIAKSRAKKEEKKLEEKKAAMKEVQKEPAYAPPPPPLLPMSKPKPAPPLPYRFKVK